MEALILPYLNQYKREVKDKISAQLANNITDLIATEAFDFHFLKNQDSRDFHVFYYASISNRDNFLSADNFFRTFKQKYSLQGIDNQYLNRLEKEKATIIQLIDNDDLATLYFKFFAKAQIQQKEKRTTKNLGSFFAKLVHTFRPDSFCALDNPIKKYFGLNKESFYFAFAVISAAYREWSDENTERMRRVRVQLENNKVGATYSDKMTDLKLLDLIFWFKANVSVDQLS